MKRYIRSTTTSNNELARNSRDIEVLAQLANDADEHVRWFVAQNPNTPADILEQLADDGVDFVRLAVADRPNTPADILEQLADDEDAIVRRSVALHPNTPVDVLEQLANDTDARVREYAVHTLNPSADAISNPQSSQNRSSRKSSQHDRLLPGSTIYDRLINRCYWSEDNAWGIIEDNEEYNLSELINILSDACVNSGEFDSASDAVEWGKECARAIFENRSPH